MDNDKAFTLYALVLTAGVASVITASVMTGITTLPTPTMFLEHLALSLGFRAAYKSIGGFDVSDWTFQGADEAAAEATPAPVSGFTADATS